MRPATRKLWALQDRHEGDRLRLFNALARAVEATTVLYPGSFVDIAASFVFDDVTYVDTDDRAKRFFADAEGVASILTSHRPAGRATPALRFIHADYAGPLDLDDGSFDLLLSLYAGFVSEHCTRYLRIGGTLVANPSHGDVAMASIDERYELTGVVQSKRGRYRVTTDDLPGYLIPKRAAEITAESLHRSGRGVGYTRSPFAYLFRRTA